MKAKRLVVLVAAVIVGLTAWLTAGEWRRGDAIRPIVPQTGPMRLGADSPEAIPPFGSADGKASVSAAPAAAGADRGGIAVGTVPIAPGSKAWRFERPLVGDVSAGTLYARLAQRGIDANNARDAAIFAEVMSRCRRRAMEMKMLQAERSESAKATEFEQRQTELLEQSIRATESLCSDAPPDAAASSDAWLTRAAELGDPLARYYYGMGMLSWLFNIDAIYGNPERLVEYKPRALEYLNELSSQGHFDSLVLLSSMYLGPMYGPDPALSWAYRYAAIRAEGDSTKQDRALRQLQGFSPGERIRAEREAERIYERCCR